MRQQAEGSGYGGPELFVRAPANPVLTPDDWPYPANSVFNPGAALVDGQTVLLCRVEDRRGISHLTVARSADGATGWKVDESPLIAADRTDRTSCWGVEDARCSRIDELDSWLISYTAYGPGGPCVALAITQDFREVEHIGIAMPPEDKNASLLSRHIDGKFVLFHRPAAYQSGRADVWLSRSTDLRSWTAPEPVLRARPSIWWDSVRIGFGPPPLDTPHGWLCVYHGVKQMVSGPIYRAGLVLLDRDNPTRVLRRSEEWVLGPRAGYERHGDVPNTIFPTGLVHDPGTGDLRLYYGAGDTVVAMASAPLDAVLEYVLACPEGDSLSEFES
ncbi:MAG TPA: hypothetical protein VJT31_24360 [Rugosimonospora sp.]|nr:hypothetical protein [Rugosimonospora sp.]